MKKSVFIILIISLTAFIVNGQSLRQLLHNGKKSVEAENFEAAVFFYDKAIKQSESPAIAWNLAESARFNRDYHLAEKWYSFVFEHEPKSYPLSPFWLGMVQKNMGSYQKAIISFRKYYLANIKNKDYFSEKARHEISSCENALFMTFDPVETPFKRMDSVFNSPFSEFQMADINDSLKYLTSLRPENDNDSLQYFSKILSFKTEQGILTKSILDTNFNIPKKNISSFTFVPGTQKIIFSACERKPGKFKCELYQTEKLAEQWLPPTLLSDSINSPGASTTNPCYARTPQGDFLLFASDRSDGFGKLDLWYSKIDSTGNYNNPVNMGKGINSIDDECTPFYDEKTQTLYFASEWFDNLGGTDIFYVQGNIEELKYPQNLGFPLNSCNYDVFYTIANNKEHAYFSSNRTADKTISTAGCCNDIFQITLPKPKPDSIPDIALETKLKQQTTELIPISLFFHNDEPNPRTWDTVTTLNYATTAENYLNLREDYQKWWSQDAKENEKDKALAEVESFFIDSVEKNFHKLIQFSQLMEKLLVQGESIEITIKGFASPLNSNAYNINLSKRRTQSLVNYFREYKNGFFIPYLEKTDSAGTTLTIKQEAFGEEMVVKGVSDNLNDLRNSVYSPAAACERKIAVIAVAFPK